MSKESPPNPVQRSGATAMHCVVCGHISHGYHFGILACRACAAFFRRTIAEDKSYKCRGKLDCIVSKEQRNMCRACRFKKCEELGMNREDVQLNRDPIGRKHDPMKTSVAALPSASTATTIAVMPANGQKQYLTTNNPPFSLVPFSNLGNLSVLERLRQGMSNYQTSQKSLYKVLYPDQLFEKDDASLVSHAEFMRMDKACISLMHSMLNDFFAPYGDLDKETKVNLLQSFSCRFGLLESTFRSYVMGASLPESRWFVHYGQCIDENHMDHFLTDIVTKEESSKTMRFVFGKLRKLRNLFQRARTDETEVAAVSGILLWNEASLLLPSWEPCEQIREAILSELHNYLITKHGIGGTGSRIGNLMCVVHEVNCVAKEINEHVTMEKIFNPQISDFWDAPFG